MLLAFLSALPTAVANPSVRGGALKETRIIDGDDAPPGRYPYAASLQDDDGHYCGGSLVGRNVVLSAGHCAPSSSHRVRSGATTRTAGER